MIDTIKKIVAPLQRRVMMAISRAVINSVDDSKSIQKIQISLLADEVIDRLERIQEYGFSSAPLPGAEAVALFVGGNRDHGVVIATDDRRYRKKTLVNGEVALYTDQGDYIHFKREGTIEILASTKVKVTAPVVEIVASTQVTITSPLVHMSGNLTVTGDIAAATIEASGVGIASIKSTFNSHTHTETGGTTSAPTTPIP